MKNHIYLHTSNIKQIESIREDEKFEGVYDYYPSEFQMTHRNEYGRINTKENYFHILIGNMRYKGCPWCGNACELKRLGEDVFNHFIEYCMQCPKCKSRGPILSISESGEENKENMSVFAMRINQIFENRKQWDSDLINPYEITTVLL